MKTTSSTLAKGLVMTVAAGAMAVSSIAPAMAKDGGGIGAGEIIAGALILGGVAAVAASAGNKDDGYDYARRGHDRWGSYGRGQSGQAVNQCAVAAERNARGRYGRADVTGIRSVKQKRYGYEVKGRIAVNARGWNNRSRGSDTGTFTCRVEGPRIVSLSYSGIRGL